MMEHEWEPLEPEDERLWERLSSHLAAESDPGLMLSDQTLEALDAQSLAVPLSSALKSRLTRIARQAEADLEFETALKARRQRPTLGTYLAYLRGKAGWTASETAKRVRLEFQWLADLERDALPPAQIPARRLMDLLKRLKGSLEVTERLLPGTIQAPRLLGAAGRSSLYRRGSGPVPGRWVEPPDPAPTQENPEFLEQQEDVAQLQTQLRALWRP